MQLERVCVYCGANTGRDPAYADAARAMGRALARRGIGLVTGGGRVGLMGVVADAALHAGGSVTGVIPQALMKKELAHTGLTELVVTGSMHERKARMAELAQGFVALPGGLGTYEELFEIWTWAQLGWHRKPCGLLNAAGFYDKLVGFLDDAAGAQFLKAEHRAMLVVETDPDRLLDRFAAYEAPDVAKWIGADQT
ncbi:pyrimidine/purine-5'-nucleotide nucleosidase [Burkholderiales bacterium]|nr:pyrimidine/purine-5'-nucleotide nucleosidase [Burkholderiales bacterium]